MKKFVLCCLILLLNIVSQVFADCGYDLTTPSFSYTVSDTNPTTPGTVSIERTKDNGNPCSNFFFAFTKGGAGNYNRRATNLSNSDLLYYNIYKNSNSSGTLKEVSDITSTNEVLYGPISKNETKTLTYYFTLGPLDANIPPRAGMYVDIIQVQAYSGFYNNINAYEGYRDLYIYLTVPKFISLSLVDTGDTHDPAQTSKTLDFNELEDNEFLEFDVRIVSNAGYVLKVSSGNNGKLIRVGGSGSSSEVLYDFYANGIKKVLTSSASTPVTIASATGRTASGGAKVPIKVIVTSVDNKDPGTYQDYITLTVISND